MLLLGAALALAPVLAPLAHGQTVLPPPQPDAQADARQDQIEELQHQLSQATADNETLQHQLHDARAEIARLQGVVSDLTAANANAVQNASGASSDGPKAPATEQTSSLNSAQIAATGTLGSMPANAAPPGAPAPSSADVYANARALLNAGNYAEAEVAFTDFLHDYPSSHEAPEARYWLGSTQLARNNYTDAASTFVDYLRHSPTSANAPLAQVNLGVALAHLDHKPQACAAFADVPRHYPRSSQAVRDRAAREARALNCGA